MRQELKEIIKKRNLRKQIQEEERRQKSEAAVVDAKQNRRTEKDISSEDEEPNEQTNNKDPGRTGAKEKSPTNNCPERKGQIRVRSLKAIET